ncbi:MAG: response regulator [Chloroflexi bacterium]|nr:response regulator [Chloroflexota bacterium]
MPLEVLLAEDDPDIAYAVTYGIHMTWPGSQVRVARDGTEALALFAEATPDLVVLDLIMPPPDGLTVLRHIRESSHVPVLMLTAHHATIDKMRALDFGADAYLTKPFDHRELLARLRALLRRSGSTDQEYYDEVAAD